MQERLWFANCILRKIYFKVCDVYTRSIQNRVQYWPLHWKHAATVESWCVSTALDILQSPSVLQLCKEKGSASCS